MIGKKFGRLSVLEYAFSKNQFRYWKCICDCGKEAFVKTKYLNNGWSEMKDQPKPKKSKKKDPVWEVLKEENDIQKENE